jgi:hypothetical protein
MDVLELPQIEITGPQSPAFKPTTEHAGSPELDDFRAIDSPKLLEDVVQIQDEAISKRVLLQNRCQDFQEQFVHLRAAMDAFYNLYQSIDGKLATGPSQVSIRQTLRDAFDRMKESRAILNKREEMMQQTANESCIIDDKLLRREKSLLHRINKARERYSLNRPLPNKQMEDVSSLASSSSSEDSKQSEATVVREYYDRLAQANSLRDGVINFEAATAGERRRREKLRLLQQSVEPSETEFLQRYFAKREEKHLAFEEALQEAYRLRDECMGKGHTVEEPGIPPLGEQTAFDESLLLPQTIVQKAMSENLATKSWNDVDSLLISDADSTKRVAQWLQDQGVPELDDEQLPKSSTTRRSGMVGRRTPHVQSHSFSGTKREDLLPDNSNRHRSTSQPLLQNVEFRRRSLHDMIFYANTDLAISAGHSTPNSAPAFPSQPSCF